jgi:hypothetical protein
MKYLLLKWLMKLSGELAPRYVDKVDLHIMEEWLESLSEERSGYKHYYTKRKKAIQESMVSGLTPEQYWMIHGRIAELQYMNAISLELIKKRDKKKQKKNL